MKRRPSRTPSSSRPSKPRKQFPLDPSLTVQRKLFDPTAEIARVTLKSPTRHPTVYRKRIAETPHGLSHGDLVDVVADDGSTTGFGYWNPRAEATIKIVRWGSLPPDAAWWKSSLADAIRLRTEQLSIAEATEAYRLINAEGDGFPGLVVDRYGPVLSLQAFTLGMYQRAEAIAQLLMKLMDAEHWVVRPGPSTLEQEGFVADGVSSADVPRAIKFLEHDVRYEVQPFGGHKTGFFCDQRDNRQRLRQYCRGKSVLDLCCYAGGFSVNAALAGASSVTGVDLDEEAIDLARRNNNLNQLSVRFVHADAFAYMRDMQRNGKRFDVVVLDPPKLIRNREEMHEGQNKYFDLNQLAVSLVNPGGILLTCSCSGLLSMEEFTKTVRAATTENHRIQLIARTGAGSDHPVAMNCLESEYLKCLWLRVVD